MNILYNGMNIVGTGLFLLISTAIFLFVLFILCNVVYDHLYPSNTIIMTISTTNKTISISRSNNKYITKGKVKGYNVYYNIKIDTYIDDDSKIFDIPDEDISAFVSYVNERNPITFKVYRMYTVHELSSFGTFINGIVLIQSTEDTGSFATITVPGSIFEYDDFNSNVELHIIK